MSIFTDKSSPLGTIWCARLVIPGRKSHKQRRFEKSLVNIKANILFGHLTDAQNDMSLRIMSQLLFGFTKIVNIQSSSIYQNTIQLLGSIHRELGIEQKGVDLAPTTANIPQSFITLPENPYFMEYPFDVVRTLDAPNETQYDLLATVAPQVDDITLSPAAAQPMELLQAMEVNGQQLLKDNMPGDVNQLNIVDEFAPGPSRQPQPSRSHSFGMNDQMVSADDDNNMDDYMNWSGLFHDFAQGPPPNNATANRSNSSADGYQQVPVISPGAHQQEHQNTTNLMTGDAIDINSPLWDISGLSVSAPPAALPPTELLPPPNLSAWMNEDGRPEMEHNNNDDNPFMSQIIDSPAISMQTDDYHQLVPRTASPTPPPVAPRLRRHRRRRGLMDQGSTTLPVDAFIDTNEIVMARPPAETGPLPALGPQSRGPGLKRLVNRYRTQMQQPTMTISNPTNFWLREARIGRQMNTVIEQGRRLEHGRDRDPHSHDDFAFSNAGGDSDTHRLSSVDVTHLGQDHFDFEQMALVDDRHDRQGSNTSTSSTRIQQLQQQLLQGRRTSDSSFGHPLTSSTASDRGRQGTGLSDEPNYNELLELGVDLEAPDFIGQEFYEFLLLAPRDQDDVCVFESVYPKGSGGSKRSEVALAFYNVLACSALNQIRPEQNEPYGPLYLHLLQNNGV